MRSERGVVVGVRGATATVRLAATDACAGCAAAGSCRSAAGGERLIEARNDAGAGEGASVEVLVDDVPERRRRARAWLAPLLGLVLAAALAQAIATRLLGPGAAARAAGIGGILGALAGAALARAWPGGAPQVRPPVLARVLAAPRRPRVDSPSGGG